jgi:hypothetical protein
MAGAATQSEKGSRRFGHEIAIRQRGAPLPRFVVRWLQKPT